MWSPELQALGVSPRSMKKGQDLGGKSRPRTPCLNSFLCASTKCQSKAMNQGDDDMAWDDAGTDARQLCRDVLTPRT